MDANGEAHFELACPREDEAQNGVAHGGWTASALDEALGRVLSLRGHMAVVGKLTLSFDRPVPIGHPLAARSWVETREPRKWHVAGELTLRSSGAVLARASGVFVLRDRDVHYSEFEEWLGQQQRHD
jgi:acyl-coenzyme A thioesterase PaaI-like protein